MGQPIKGIHFITIAGTTTAIVLAATLRVGVGTAVCAS
tara:strand:- start:72410 stop:72523 length:114 start_codon:yes stop_codon:yes gene_type:complete